MRYLLAEAGVAGVAVSSAATSTEAVGCDMHRGSKEQLDAAGIPFSPRAAHQITEKEARSADMIVCMDTANINNLRRMIPCDLHSKIHRILDFTQNPRDVADPWYTHDYAATFSDVSAGCKGLLKHYGR